MMDLAIINVTRNVISVFCNFFDRKYGIKTVLKTILPSEVCPSMRIRIFKMLTYFIFSPIRICFFLYVFCIYLLRQKYAFFEPCPVLFY